jgi:hypothetical protein
VLILGLDFDGVLHPVNSLTEPKFCRMELLETWLRAHPWVDVVITSSWRSFHPLDEMQSYFAEDLKCRVLGCTPHAHELFGQAWSRSPDEAAAARYERQAELEAWMRSANRELDPWIAVDDDPSLFAPGHSRLVVCDSRTGLTAGRLEELHTLAEQHQDGR